MLRYLLLCAVLLVDSINAIPEGSNVYCVKPNHPNISCDNTSTSCENLHFYAANTSYYFSNDTTLEFLPGEHVLDMNIFVKYTSNLMLTGNPVDVCMAKTAQLQSGNGPPLITCRGEAGIIVQNSQNVTISTLSMANCGQSLPPTVFIPEFEVKAALIFDVIKNLALISLRVYNSNGYGLLMHNIHGNSIINSCELLYNRGNSNYMGGNALLNYTSCHQNLTSDGAEMEIRDSTFSFGSSNTHFSNSQEIGVLATGIGIILSCTGVTIIMDNVTAEGNQNFMTKRGLGGNVFIHFYGNEQLISCRVYINNCNFFSGKSWVAGGLGISIFINATDSHLKCENTVYIVNSVSSGNTAITGSGLYYLQRLSNNICTASVTVDGCVFRNNTIHVHTFGNAGVVAVIGERLSGVESTDPNAVNITFDNVTVEHSTLNKIDNYRTIQDSASFYIRNFLENLKIHNTKFIDNNVSAISVFRSRLTLSGENLFKNNSGLIGGGMKLCEASNLVLVPHTNITFLENHALHAGGAIYISDSCLENTPPMCFYQFEGISGNSYINVTQAVIDCDIRITMINNTAEYAGSQIYGGNVAHCYIQLVSDVMKTSMFRTLFHLDAPSSDLSTVTSSPKSICFCSNSSEVKCSENQIQYSHSIYPGENITIPVVITGQLDGTIPGLLRVNISNDHYSYYSTTTSCSQISFTTFLKDQSSLNVYEFIVAIQLNSKNYPISKSKYLKVKFKQCPRGYELDQENGMCECNKNWKQIKCDFSHRTLTRSYPAWLGFIGEELVYQDVCPRDYCSGESVRMKIANGTFNPDQQCSQNRKGVLCGACKEGFSLSAGSFNCIDCTRHSILHLVGYLFTQFFCGVALIVLLTLSNWTITDGTFSGLLFYANVFKQYMFMFLPRRFNAITVILSMINLEFQVTNCIYNGLDFYTKAWLSFIFPLYVWILIAAIIYLSKHFKFMSTLLGGNGVRILATLIELSYTGLTQAVVIAVSPIRVTLFRENINQTSTVYRWVYDPNVPYLGIKHLPLFLTGSLFGVLILAHTLVLLFVQPLQRCSHLPCFSWVAKLKPLIDAYTSPHLIKAKRRFWPGLLLTVRLVLVVILAFNVKLEDSINITAIASSCFFLAIVAWSVGGIYRKTYLNVLNSFFVLNLSVLILARNFKPGVTVSYISASLTILVMCFVLLCHVLMRLKGLFMNGRDVIFLRNLLQSKKECSEESDLLASFSR